MEINDLEINDLWGGFSALQFQNNHCAAEQIRSTQVSTPNVELFSERS